MYVSFLLKQDTPAAKLIQFLSLAQWSSRLAADVRW